MAGTWLPADGPLQAMLDKWNVDNPSQELVDEHMAAAGYRSATPTASGPRTARCSRSRSARRSSSSRWWRRSTQQLHDAGFDARQAPFDDRWRTDVLNGTFDTMIFVHCGSISEPLDTLQHFHCKYSRPRGRADPLRRGGDALPEPRIRRDHRPDAGDRAVDRSGLRLHEGRRRRARDHHCATCPRSTSSRSCTSSPSTRPTGRAGRRPRIPMSRPIRRSSRSTSSSTT